MSRTRGGQASVALVYHWLTLNFSTSHKRELRPGPLVEGDVLSHIQQGFKKIYIYRMKTHSMTDCMGQSSSSSNIPTPQWLPHRHSGKVIGSQYGECSTGMTLYLINKQTVLNFHRMSDFSLLVIIIIFILHNYWKIKQVFILVETWLLDNSLYDKYRFLKTMLCNLLLDER